VPRHLQSLLAQAVALADPPRWHERAACRGVGPSVFFPDSTRPAASEAAVRYCADCPVVEQCAEAGARERYGIWAGQAPGRRVPDLQRTASGGRAAVLGGVTGP
jgi:hypothetical protein